MPTALIVGASRGLGRAIVETLLERGWSVIATVRQRDALDDMSNERLRVEVVDTTDWAGIDALHDRLDGAALDLLFVNAGISGPTEAPIGAVDGDAFTELMLVNVLAPLRIIDRFADLAVPSGTIGVMSSRLGSIGFNTTAGYEAYRTSKAALNMGLKSLAIRHADGRTWLAVHPGWVRTDMGGPSATFSIEESVTGIVDMFEARAGSGGITFVDHANQELPW
jgi:NAD(P)-dependent dehydrogenase (short-subunit alcohol dehydrogenase family)